MKITRTQFLKLIPAAALALSGCSAASSAAPASSDGFVFDHAMKMAPPC